MDGIFFPDSGLERETLEPGASSRKVRARGGRVMLVEVSFVQGAVGAVHAHPHDQASYCLAGEFRFTVGGESRTLAPGDSVFVPGGTSHGTLCLAEGRLLDAFSPQREDFLKK
jgi:quercetin dioxygenase-like cupin family protein